MNGISRELFQDYGIFLQLSCIYPRIESSYFVYSGIQFLSYFLVLLIFSILFPITMYFSYGDGDIETTTRCIYYLIMIYLSFYILVWANLNRPILTEINNKTDQALLYNDLEGLHVDKLEEKSRKIRRMILKFVKVYFVLCALAFISRPVIDLFFDRKLIKVTNCNSDLPAVLWTPYDSSKGIGYGFTLSIEVFAAFVISSILSSSVLISLTMNEKIRENLIILNYCLDNIEQRTINTFNNRYSRLTSRLHHSHVFEECFLHSLIQVAKHYQNTIRLSHLLQKIGTWSYIYIFMSGPILIATIMYSFLSDSASISNKIEGVVNNCFAILSIGILSWYAEELKTLNKNCLDYLYFMPWLERSGKVRRAIYFMQTAGQREIIPIYPHLIISVNLHTFKEIISAAYTYIMFIYTMRSTNTQ